MDGDVVDAVEAVSEHLITTHVHDNRGRTDDHLVPFEGSIDWPAALTTVQKVGYEGVLLFEIAAHGSARQTLKKARSARKRIEGLLAR
jgi:sugar phosphate isomerase/epimerase